MKNETNDLSGWLFHIDEVSAGVYQVRGVDRAGRKVQKTGTDPDALLEECKRAAVKIIQGNFTSPLAIPFRPHSQSDSRLKVEPQVKIVYTLTESTVDRETNRVSDMSYDDLLWCFDAEVKFMVAGDADARISIDAPLFGFASDYLGALRALKCASRSVTMPINDRYGGFILKLTKIGDLIRIVEEYDSGSLEVTLNELATASLELVENLIHEAGSRIPGLVSNSSFARICDELRRSGPPAPSAGCRSTSLPCHWKTSTSSR